MFWPRKDHSRSIAELRESVRTLSGKLEVLEDEHQKLKAAHVSLRGYTYALKHHAGLTPAEPNPAPKAPTRDELRRMSGFLPGKPMEHKDGNT